MNLVLPVLLYFHYSKTNNCLLMDNAKVLQIAFQHYFPGWNYLNFGHIVGINSGYASVLGLVLNM